MTSPDTSRVGTIEVFADVLCPFTHVGLRRLVSRRRALDSAVVLRIRAWPLELVNGEPLAAALVAEEVVALREQVAPDLFAGFDPTAFPATSLPALALVAAAYERSDALGEQVSLALRDALFEHGRDVGSVEVLADIAAAHGLPIPEPDDMRTVLLDWEEGRARGVEGSPHFFVEDEDFFCPTLEITRVDDQLRITRDPARFEAFLARAFPDAPDQDAVVTG